MKKIRYLLLVLIIAMLAATALIACNKDIKITYYLDENTVYRTDKFSKKDGVTLPAEPTSEQNDFSGWYLDLGFEQEFKAENALDYVDGGKISVYAKWTPKITVQTFQVKFIDFDESVIQVDGKDIQTVESGQAAVAPANPVRDGYYFAGWSASFTEVTQNLNITAVYKLVLNVTPVNKTIIYGDAAPAFSLKYSTILNPDIAAPVLSGEALFSCGYSAGNDAGEYQIGISGLSSSEYHLNFSTGALTVNKKILTVTADNKSIAYDAAAPVYTATLTGLISGDSFEDYTVSSTYAQGDATGSYVITAAATAQIAEKIIKNYAINYVNGTLTVNKLQYGELTHGDISSEYTPNATLADISNLLDENWRWANGSQALNVGTYTAEILYNDSSSYEDFSFMVTLNISKATLTIAGVAGAVLSTNGTLTRDQIGANVYHNGVLIEGIYAYGDTDFDKGTTAYVNFSFEGNDYYNPAESVVIVKIKSVDVKGTFYTIEDAIYSSQTGDTAIVKANTDFCSDANIINALYNTDSYYTIKAGVLLLLPYDNTFSASNQEMDTANSHHIGVTPYVEVYAQDISLTIFGSLMVNGKTTRWNGAGGVNHFPQQGHTSQVFSQLRLARVNITVKDGGSLIANGLILDNGNAGTGIRFDYVPSNNIVAESGAVVQDLMAIHDHRKAQNLNSIYESVFPYNQYTLHNIEANIKIEYGANYNVRWTIVFAQNANEKNTGVITYIGSNQGALYQMTSGYATKSFNKYTARNTIDFFGNVFTNEFTVTVKLVPLSSIMTIEVSSDGLFFPVPGSFTINVNSDVFTVNTNMKLLPGAELNVQSGAIMILSSGKQIAAYSENQYTDIWSSAANNGAGGTGPEGYPLTVLLPLSNGFWFGEEGYGWDFAASDKANVTINGNLIAYGNYGGPITVAENGRAMFLGTVSVDFKETTSATATKTMTATVPSGALGTLNKIAVMGVGGNAGAIKDFYFSNGISLASGSIMNTIPHLSGYELRLFEDSAFSVAAEGQFTASTTLYAGYYKNAAFIFDDNTSQDIEQRLNGSFVFPERIEHGGKTVTGYYYIHGSTLAQTVLPDDAVFNGSIVVFYAYYQEHEITITLNPQGGFVEGSSIVKSPLETLSVSQIIPTKENHDFDGWFYDAAYTAPFVENTVVLSDLTLYAKWSVQTVIDSIDQNNVKTFKYVPRGATFTLNERPASESGYVYFWHSDTFAYDGLLIGGSGQIINYIAEDTTFKLVKYRIIDGSGTLTKAVADAITGEENLYITGYTVIANNAFQNRTDIKRVILVDAITIEDGLAAVQTTSFTSAPTPSGVVGTFNGCNNLISVYMLKVETIGYFAFFGLGDNFRQAVILTDAQPEIKVFQYGAYSSGTTRRAAYAYAFGRTYYITASNNYGAASTTTTSGTHGANNNMKIYVKTGITYDSYWGVYSACIVKI